MGSGAVRKAVVLDSGGLHPPITVIGPGSLMFDYIGPPYLVQTDA